PQSCAIDGASASGSPDVETLRSAAWTEILPRSALEGDTKNAFAIASELRFTHLRFHIFPDGGVARLRVHGDVVPDARWLGRRDRPQLVDLAAAENGALVVSCNDMFFGSRHNLIMPGRGVNMGDGWETKRSRRAGPDWVVVRLATEGDIERAIVDTLHFKGNAPDACAIDVATSAKDPDGKDERAWRPLLGKTNLQPHTQHVFGDLSSGGATHVRLRIWPDGGISRLRLFGVATEAGRERSGMRNLRALPDAALRAELLDCCGSRAWVDAVAKERPLKDFATLKKAAARAWDALAPRAWEEAFRAHPRIGEKKAKGPQTAHAQSWSAKEQAKVASADDATLDALRRANRAYERKFGRTYIVCATGKTASEMLAIAKERMKNDKKTELRRAADEQKKITELRLEKLVMR
ncbi:MAG TPA: 2-oxo-4-hydroxy-4-carboxy-5-ureidoimidazoline decarboxylase, partial [Labilithrix sp.]